MSLWAEALHRESGLVPRPLISHDFILTEMVSLIQIETAKKSEVKGPGDITRPKIQITSRELSFWGVLVYIYLNQCRVFFKKFNHICTHCSLNPKLIWAGLNPGRGHLLPVTLLTFAHVQLA